MRMRMRGDKVTQGQGERVKISLLPNNVDKKSVNDAGPQQGHDNCHNFYIFDIII